MSEQNLSIQPISVALQEQVIRETNHLIKSAGDYFNHSFNEIPVLFDLSGKAAGMYRVKAGQRVIRYNPYIFSKYYDDNLIRTMPHEVAHYITDVFYGLRNIKPHGSEWKNIMLSFDAEPAITSDYDLTGIPVRQLQRFEYQCGCMKHQLTAIRHNKVMRGKVSYRCKYCASPVVFCE